MKIIFQKKHYDGQESVHSGSGGIEDPFLYMESRYGDGWKIKHEKHLDMNCYSMSSLSAYIINGYTEGNCWAVAAYNCIQAIEKLQWIYNGRWLDIPGGDTEFRKQTLYRPQLNEIWQYDMVHKKEKYVKLNERIDDIFDWRGRFPDLWVKMRQILNEKKKYINGGGATWDTSWLVQEEAKHYGHKINGVEHYAWQVFASRVALHQLQRYMPLAWSTCGDTYGNHPMAVCGYKYFERTTTTRYWCFKWHETTKVENALLYELCDGWTQFNYDTLTSPTHYYDMSAYNLAGCLIDFHIL